MKKRRHHYIWQHYLCPWASDRKIWCLRDGKVFETSTINIGQERDFYRVEELSSQDIEYIRVMAVNSSVGLLKRSNEDWLPIFQHIFKVRDLLISKGIRKDDLEESMDIFLNNIEEEFHAMIEGNSIKYINNLIALDVTFFDNEEDRMAFYHYLCVQYLRTKNIKENLLKNMSSMPQTRHINMDGCWSIMRHIFATNIAFSLFADKTFKLVLAEAAGSEKYITGDQPIINTFAVVAGRNNLPEDMEFYYPISPSTALLVTRSKEYSPSEKISIGNDDVVKYNNAIFKSSFEQIYASSKDQLSAYI